MTTVRVHRVRTVASVRTSCVATCASVCPGTQATTARLTSMTAPLRRAAMEAHVWTASTHTHAHAGRDISVSSHQHSRFATNTAHSLYVLTYGTQADNF